MFYNQDPNGGISFIHFLKSRCRGCASCMQLSLVKMPVRRLWCSNFSYHDADEESPACMFKHDSYEQPLVYFFQSRCRWEDSCIHLSQSKCQRGASCNYFCQDRMRSFLYASIIAMMQISSLLYDVFKQDANWEPLFILFSRSACIWGAPRMSFSRCEWEASCNECLTSRCRWGTTRMQFLIVKM